MIDLIDFDKLPNKLYKCETYQITTPQDVQEKFNKSYKKSSNKNKRSSNRTNAQRKKENVKTAIAEVLCVEEAGLSREEKRISRQIFLMQQFEESKMPKKIKKQKNIPQINERIDLGGLSLSEYIQNYISKYSKNSETNQKDSLKPISLEGVKDCTAEFKDIQMIKPDEN